LQAQELTSTWAKKIESLHNAYSSELVVDHDGFIWVLAYTDASINNLPYKGGNDAYLAKMDADGTIIWEQMFGGFQDDRAEHLAIDEHNNCWVSGYFSDTLWVGDSILVSNGGTDAFLLKFNPNGNLINQQKLGGTGYDSGHHLAIYDNSVYWIGIYQGQLNLSVGLLEDFGLNDVFLLKLDSIGQHLWVKNWGCPSIEHIIGLTIDSSENITAATLFKDLIYFNSDTLWGVPSTNNLIIQFDPTGQLNWQTSFEGTGRGLSNDEQGAIYYTGSFEGTLNLLGTTISAWAESDAFVLSLDTMGQLQWLSEIHGHDQTTSHNVVWDSKEQQLYLSGLAQGTVYYGNDSLKSSTGARHVDDDIIILIYDRNGSPLSAQKIGGNYEDWVSSLVIHPINNNLYLYGSFEGDIDFGNDTLQNNGQRDLYIAQFNLHPVAINKYSAPIITSPKLAPNPVINQSHLTFTLTETTFLSINVLNIQGQIVQNILTEQSQKGTYQLTFRPDNQLIDGLYWIQFQTPKGPLSIPLKISQK
jgi:hypothetical protein